MAHDAVECVQGIAVVEENIGGKLCDARRNGGRGMNAVVVLHAAHTRRRGRHSLPAVEPVFDNLHGWVQ